MGDSQVDNLDDTKLKKILLNLERRTEENQKARIKHAESPTKFASSETELFAALDELQSVATQPELYPILISKKTLQLLISLLGHENTDISAKVIGMLQEFTDIDEAEDHAATELLIEALRNEDIIKQLVSNLPRLDEKIKEEANAINNTLAIIDNLIDFDSRFASQGTESLITWMIKQLKREPEFNAIKLSISELLSVLLMNGDSNKEYLNEIGGIDVLLQQVAFYRRIAPITGDEHEFLEQTINCLCTAVLNSDINRQSFYDEEGVDLVRLILKEKKDAVKKSNIKVSVLKLFNHVLSTDLDRDQIVTKSCERFVENLGLGVLFPIFNNPKLIINEKVKKREYQQTIDEIEEHTSAIMLALLKYCQNSEYIQRILVKFAESNYEKLNRLFSLHEKYFRLKSKRATEEAADTESESNDLLGRSGGYFTLRTIDYIILLVCYLSNHFETYDPNSGETFSNRICTILARRPEFRHQITMEVSRHIEEVGGVGEERNSLELLLEYFSKIHRQQKQHSSDTKSGNVHQIETSTQNHD